MKFSPVKKDWVWRLCFWTGYLKIPVYVFMQYYAECIFALEDAYSAVTVKKSPAQARAILDRPKLHTQQHFAIFTSPAICRESFPGILS
jgi:hypothetical protein